MAKGKFKGTITEAYQKAYPLPLGGGCLSSLDLIGFRDGIFSAERRKEIAEHITACRFCARQLAKVSRFFEEAESAHAMPK